MKTLKSYLADIERTVIWYRADDADAREAALQAIEEGQEYQFDKQWTARFDRGLQPNQQDHLHIRFKGRDVCVINADGSPSHNTPDASTLPGHVRRAVKKTGKVTIEEAIAIDADLSAWRVPRAVINAFEMQLLAGHR